jgi:hypothetical protein
MAPAMKIISMRDIPIPDPVLSSVTTALSRVTDSGEELSSTPSITSIGILASRLFGIEMSMNGMTMHIHVPTINATLLSLKNVVFRITSMKNE